MMVDGIYPKIYASNAPTRVASHQADRRTPTTHGCMAHHWNKPTSVASMTPLTTATPKLSSMPVTVFEELNLEMTASPTARVNPRPNISPSPFAITQRNHRG